MEVVTVERDPVTAALAADNLWPDWVRLVVGEAVDIARRAGRFDLIFADALGGKWEGLDVTVAALRPAGQLLVDDMTPQQYLDAHHERKTAEVRRRLLDHPDLISVEIAWPTGLILSTRRLH